MAPLQSLIGARRFREQRCEIVARPDLGQTRKRDQAYRFGSRFAGWCVVSVHGLVFEFGSLLSRSRPVIARRTKEPKVSCWAVVAINTRLRRKRRLRGALDAADRDALTRRMLDSVLAAADGAVSPAAVVSSSLAN